MLDSILEEQHADRTVVPHPACRYGAGSRGVAWRHPEPSRVGGLRTDRRSGRRTMEGRRRNFHGPWAERRSRARPSHRSAFALDQRQCLFPVCLPVRGAAPPSEPAPDERDQPALGLGRRGGFRGHGFRAHQQVQGIRDVAPGRMGGSGYRSRQPAPGGRLALELELRGESTRGCSKENLVRRDAHSSEEHRSASAGSGPRDAHQLLPLPGSGPATQIRRLATNARRNISRSRSIRAHEARGVMAGEAVKSLRISQVGLRGVVGGGLTAAHVLDFASAFGTFLEPGKAVIIGRDPRASGTMIREGVVAGLLACGRNVIDLGIAPTPVIQHTIRRMDAAGGISIGASHNAAEWNALKFFGRNAIYLSTAEANELLDIYHLKKFGFVEWDRLGELRGEEKALDPYLDDL